MPTTYEITNGAEHVTCADADTFNAECARLYAIGKPLTIHETNGDGVRRPVLIDGRSPAETSKPAATPVVVASPAPVAAPAAVAPSPATSDDVDASAKARIDAQQADLRAAGFTGVGHVGSGGDGEQFFTNGTRLADSGRSRVREMKAEHAANPFAREAGERLIARVVAEGRTNVETTTGEIARSLQVGERDGITCLDGRRLMAHAIEQALTRVESPAWPYLRGLRDRIAAEKANGEKANREAMTRDLAEIARVAGYELNRRPDEVIKARCRDRGMYGRPDVFACLTPVYADGDAPETLGPVLDQLPADARGIVFYNPATTRWELRAELFTPTEADIMAVGEPFKGGASFWGSDNGGGAWKGGGFCDFIRCTNATVYTAKGATGARVHRGDMRKGIAVVVKGALGAMRALVAAWGKARADVIAVPDTVTIEQAIPGFYRSLLNRSQGDLAGVLRGRTEDHVKGLTTAYWSELRHPDDRATVTRADLAQGWTRYVQGQDRETRSEAETIGGRWIVRGDGADVTYTPA